MAPSDVHVQTARRPGRRGDGSRSRGAARRLPPGCQQWRRRSSGAQRSRSVSPDRRGGLPRTDGLLARLPENAGGASAERQRVGAGNRPVNWLRSRHSPTRRTLAGFAGGAGGIGASCSKADSQRMESTLVLLRHECPLCVCFLDAWQQGQRGSRFVMPTMRRCRMVAIEVGTWRSGLSGRAPRAPALG